MLTNILSLDVTKRKERQSIKKKKKEFNNIMHGDMLMGHRLIRNHRWSLE